MNNDRLIKFLKACFNEMFIEKENDEMAIYMMELALNNKMTFEEIFNIWDDIGMLELYSKSDIIEIGYNNGLNDEDIDYIMDLKIISDLEWG